MQEAFPVKQVLMPTNGERGGNGIFGLVAGVLGITWEVVVRVWGLWFCCELWFCFEGCEDLEFCCEGCGGIFRELSGNWVVLGV